MKKMPVQPPQWTDFLSCSNCNNVYSLQPDKFPLTLVCGHSVCKECVGKVKLAGSKCKFDQNTITHNLQSLGVNHALLQIVKYQSSSPVTFTRPPDSTELIESLGQNYSNYKTAMQHVEEIAMYLQDIKSGIVPHDSELTKPMLRKLVNLVQSQLALDDGRLRLLRACRALGERSATELILAHQNPGTLSAHLWTAIRARGCQFLGPAMQEEALKLILLALEDGSELSRKVLVMFVVQKLQHQFQQASKTSIGHVVQLLYRASCFVVTKRDGDSSLMRLKESYRTYAALRREHDAQIVQIAREAGLRIAPDQWSALLYGDQDYKSHMQSVIDRLQSGESFARCIQDLHALENNAKSETLNSLIPHFEILSNIEADGVAPALQEEQKKNWNFTITCLQSVKFILQELISFLQNRSHDLWKEEEAMAQSAKFKTSFCRDVKNKGRCPRGDSCTFAHSEEELHRYRSKRKKAGLGHAASKERQGCGRSRSPLPSDDRGKLGDMKQAVESRPGDRNSHQGQSLSHQGHGDPGIYSQPQYLPPPHYPPHPGNFQQPIPPFMPPYPSNQLPPPAQPYPQRFPQPNIPYNMYHTDPRMQPQNNSNQGIPQVMQNPNAPHNPTQGGQNYIHNSPIAQAQMRQTVPVYQMMQNAPNQSAAVVKNQPVPQQEGTPEQKVPHFRVTVSIQSEPHTNQDPSHHSQSQGRFTVTQNIQEQYPTPVPPMYGQYSGQQQIQSAPPKPPGPSPNLDPGPGPRIIPSPNHLLMPQVPINQGMKMQEPSNLYPMVQESNVGFYPINVKQEMPEMLPQPTTPRDPNISVLVPSEGPMYRAHTPIFQEKQVAVVAPQRVVAQPQAIPQPHLYDPNNAILYQNPTPQFPTQNIVNPVLLAPSPSPLNQRQNPNVLLVGQPATHQYPVMEHQNQVPEMTHLTTQTHSTQTLCQSVSSQVHSGDILCVKENVELCPSPSPGQSNYVKMNVPKSIDNATVEELEQRKDEIINRLIQNQTEKKEEIVPSIIPPSPVPGSATPETEQYYDVWSGSCSSFLVMSQQSNVNIPEQSEEFQTNVVDVIAELDTRTTQVTVRGTDHINPSYSLKERTLDDTKMHAMLVKKHDYLSNSAVESTKTKQPLRALIHYSSGPQDDDDEMIPFSDRPTVSKYGPIARSVRTRPSYSELVQVNSNNDVITHPVAAASENQKSGQPETTMCQENVYSSFESLNAVSYFPASFPRSRESVSIQNNRNHPKIPTGNSAMMNTKITPTQAASNSKLLHREEAAIQQNQQNYPEDLQLAMELQQIEIGIHQKKQQMYQ